MSNKPFIPFATPDIDDAEITEVVEALKSGWITTGPKTKQFESDFSNFIGGGVQGIAVNSATAGLHLVLEALGIGKGDEVITTTLTFTATAEVVRYMGADVKLVDINPNTLNIDIDEVRKAITPQTKAIIPVHYAGLSCNMDAIFSIAKKFNLKVIEDAAHALPSTYNRETIGLLKSDATVFSFYANKTITTGEGGMIVTRNKQLQKRVKVMRLHGINKDAFDRFQSKTPAWYYEVIAPGFKYNLTDIASAMGIHQLKKLPKFLKRRQYLANRYDEALEALPLILPPKSLNSDIHSWHLYVIRLNEKAKISRDNLIQKLADNGVGTSVHYVPLHRHPYWKDRYNLTNDAFPNADRAYLNMLSIPLFTAMTDEQQDHIIATLKDLLLG
jgi:dTDP-4-amino-4,6-dideoxygalactose transaminase